MLDVKSTKLFQRLSETCADIHFLSDVERICNAALDLSSDIVLHFENYTRHDSVHIINVINIIASLLGDEGISKLTTEEVAMLLLAACWHDAGMCVSKQARNSLLRKNPDPITDKMWSTYLDAHPADRNALNEGSISKSDLLTELVRTQHHRRVQYVLKEVGLWEKWPIGKYISVRDFANICMSHGEKIEWIRGRQTTARNYSMVLCSILIRLADALDFDETRAPMNQYRNRGLCSPRNSREKYSAGEWQKHQASHGFDVTCRGALIPFRATCSNPDTYFDIIQYLDFVDGELLACAKEVELSTRCVEVLHLPIRVDRNIECIGFEPGNYQFMMDKESIVKLLGGRSAYTNDGAFVRELLQNAIDSVRTRRSILEKSSARSKNGDLLDECGRTWRPSITLRSWRNDDSMWLIVHDNGIGMTTNIIQRYLLTIGVSYYNSDEYREAVGKSGPVANSRFGIGLLSCFALGADGGRLEISTRHHTDKYGTAASRLLLPGVNEHFILCTLRDNPNPNWESILTSKEARQEGMLDKHGYRTESGTTVAICFPSSAVQVDGSLSVRDAVRKCIRCPDVEISYLCDGESIHYLTEDNLDSILSKHSWRFDSKGISKRFDLSMTDKQWLSLQDYFSEINRCNWNKKLRCTIRFFSSKHLLPTQNLSYINALCMLWEVDRYSIDLSHGKSSQKLGVDALNYFVTIEGCNVKHTVRPSYTAETGQFLERTSRRLFYTAQRIKNSLNKDICIALASRNCFSSNWINVMASRYGLDANVIRKHVDDFNLNHFKGLKKYKVLSKLLAGWSCLTPIKIPHFEEIHDLFKESYAYGTYITQVSACNGIVIPSSYSFYGKRWEQYSCGLLLLKDRYRPEVPLSRSEVSGMPLEARCALHIISSNLLHEGLDYSFFPYQLKSYDFSQSDVYEMLDKQPWIERGIRMPLSGEYLTLKQANKKIKKGNQLYLDLNLYQNIDEYLAICIAVLKRHFTVQADLTHPVRPILIISGNKDKLDYSSSPLPPELFVKPNTCINHISTGTYGCLPVYNQDHAFSQWLIKHAEKLHDEVPAQFEELVKTLRTNFDATVIDFDRQRIHIVNGLLESLRRVIIEVEDAPLLSEKDFLTLTRSDD